MRSCSACNRVFGDSLGAATRAIPNMCSWCVARACEHSRVGDMLCVEAPASRNKLHECARGVLMRHRRSGAFGQLLLRHSIASGRLLGGPLPAGEGHASPAGFASRARRGHRRPHRVLLRMQQNQSHRLPLCRPHAPEPRKGQTAYWPTTMAPGQCSRPQLPGHSHQERRPDTGPNGNDDESDHGVGVEPPSVPEAVMVDAGVRRTPETAGMRLRERYNPYRRVRRCTVA